MPLANVTWRSLHFDRLPLLCVLALFLGCASTPNTETADDAPTFEELLLSSDESEIYSAANQEFDSQNYGASLRLYMRVADLDSTHTGALVNAGLSARRLGDIDGALRWYDRALTIDPDDTTTLQNRLLAGLLLGRTGESIAIASRLVELEPQVEAYQIQLGDLYLQSGNYGAAFDAFERALQIEPANAESLYKNALAAAGLDQLNIAIPLFQASLALAPNTRAAYAPLAQALMLTEDYDGAWRVVSEGQRRGARFDPEFVLELQEQSGAVGPE